MSNALSPTALANRVQQLIDERQEHEDAIEQIDQTMESITDLLGTPSVHVKRGRPAAAPAAAAPVSRHRGRRRRGEFAMTGEESIMAFIRERKNPTTRQVNAHWKSEGRGSSADSLLGRLVKEKRLKRRPLGGKLGSEYSLGSAAPAASAAASAPAAKRGRGGYAKTAVESILDFVKEKENPTTQEIRALWRQEGRGGAADNVLSQLVKTRKLKRTTMEDQRGSRYSLP